MDNKEELENKEKELRESLTSLMYQKLTAPEQEIIKRYINFLKNQINKLKRYESSCEKYKKYYEEEEAERLKTKKVLDKTIDTYNEVLKRLAKTEIDLEIAKAKIEILELEKEEMKDE